ncbi:MAG TPA: hypothetical protein VNJ47_04405 [Nevskiales bacterium]|nr:hypothetical protein [Nevskiales bacterium]
MPERLRRAIPCAPTPAFFLSVAVAALAACSEPAPPPAPSTARPVAPGVTIEHDARPGEAHYLIASGACRIRWELRTVEPQVLLQRAQCTLPLTEQVPLLEALWQALPPAPVRQLFWGRLCPDAGCGGRELSQRLALAAFGAPEWDARRGRPVRGHENAVVQQLANAVPIYPELRAGFARQGWKIELSGVEKVLVAPAAALPYWPALQAAGVPADAKLPYDALAWFRLTPSS